MITARTQQKHFEPSCFNTVSRRSPSIAFRTFQDDNCPSSAPNQLLLAFSKPEVWKGIHLKQNHWSTVDFSHHEKCQAGWATSWNQDRQEKYQQFLICGWYQPNGRKWRGAKEPPDESVRAGLKLNIKKTKIHYLQPHYFMANRRGKGRSSNSFSLLGL